MALIGIRRALEHFVQHLGRAEGRPQVPSARSSRSSAAARCLHGRSLDSLQAIYRLGVRLAWRRLAEIGQRRRDPAARDVRTRRRRATSTSTAWSTESVRGYAEAAARQAGERLRLQRRLIDLLLAEHHRAGDPADAARRTRRPDRLAAAREGRASGSCCARPARPSPPAVGQDVLLDMEYEQPRMVVPEPDAAGRPELLHRAPDRLVRRDRPAGAAGRRGEVAALGARPPYA